MIKLLIVVQYLGRVSVHGMGVALLRDCTQSNNRTVLCYTAVKLVHCMWNGQILGLQ